MLIEKELNGLFLESCRFSKSSYELEFSGTKEGTYKSFIVSTSYNFCLSSENGVDAASNFSANIWSFIEKRLHSVITKYSNEDVTAVFNFEDGRSFFIWSDDTICDNLIIVKSQVTGEWFTIF